MPELQCKHCGVPVAPLSDEAMARMAVFSTTLRKQGMVALREHEVAVCRPCYLTYNRLDTVKRTDEAHAELRRVVTEIQQGKRADTSQVMPGGFSSSLKGILDLYSRDGYRVVWDGPLVRVVPPKRKQAAEIPE